MYICICTYIYTYVYIYVCLYTYIHRYRNTYIVICIYTYIYVHTHMYIPLELIIRGAMIAVSFFCHGRLNPLESRVEMKSVNDINSVEKNVYLVVWHESFISAHDMFISATRLVRICDTTRSCYVERNSIKHRHFVEKCWCLVV